jgi:hypothetical protein
VRQAEAGLLPEHQSIAWHEPTAVDPTRAPDRRAVVRLQVLDVPLPQGRLRVVGFFSSAAVISHFDETLAPFGSSMLTLGAPDEQR